jgi:hypothetical protein
MPEKEVSLESIVAIGDDLVARDFNGQVVILNLESGTYFGLEQLSNSWGHGSGRCSSRVGHCAGCSKRFIRNMTFPQRHLSATFCDSWESCVPKAW